MSPVRLFELGFTVAGLLVGMSRARVSLIFCVGHIRAIVPIMFICLGLTGCGTYRDIQICPQACRPVVDVQGNGSDDPTFAAWEAYSERLHKQKIYYWLTDSKGMPVTAYRYKSDMSIYEWLFSSYWPVIPTQAQPKQIAEMVVLKRPTKDVVFHLTYTDGHEDAIALRDAMLEQRKDYEVLYVK